MKSSDRVAQDLTDTISGMVHGLNMFDVQRALCAVISCGICTSAKDKITVDEMLATIYVMLRDQVRADYPKIKAMKDQGIVNATILPEQRM